MPVDRQFEEILTMFRAMPSLADLPLEAIRNAPRPENPSPTPVAEVINRTIPGTAGDLKARIYRGGTGASLPLVVFMHGGGFVVGDLASHDEMARVITAETGCVTVAFEYRLAPENPYPAAPDDCYATLEWAAANASALGADPNRIAVVGDSAGGNLATVTALQARDKRGPALRGQVLIYPVTDLVSPLPPPLGGEYLIITPKQREFFDSSYLPDRTLASRPLVSPIMADVRGLPPALVITAEYDPLCQQGEAYAEKLKQAGVETKLTRYDGAIHGFASFPEPMGKQALREVADWLKARLA